MIRLYENKHQEKNEVARHQHNTHQLLYVLDGEGNCVLDTESQKLHPDSIVLISPHTNHSIQAHSKMTVLVLEFDFRKLAEDVVHHLVEPVFAGSRVLNLSLFESSEIRQLLRKMLFEQSQAHPIHTMGLKLLLSQVLYQLAVMQREDTTQDTNTRRAKWLKHHLETRYFEIASMEEVAARAGVSSRYMNQIFKEMYDMTPYQFLTEVRLMRVKKMLRESDREIVSICFEVGFEAVSTFYRVFKKYVGVTPNVYRRTTDEFRN
ncbi:AraC family transcriptional regulator [Terribacillus saccharophilus]|uniref:AraC family transcriptional regulator n=1 Tax=Terribacillus saccharophilus TaxID=361277 RepID=UPI00398295E1